ncbi:BppU family phage baseplate upper protein [Listeria newyorkensis]|uniref:BppU family phage baseplate upper protein n=1 Tax=Listeria newyorkensis TaxID=1497681 RepID=UPI000D92FC9A|nr:BppU family phage baseplate upper protein [Listeria newyorkensis]SQC55150.1 Uncharacterised protein [Listeria newyorkensis]
MSITRRIFVRDDGSTYNNMDIINPDKGIIKYTMAKEVFARQGELNLCYFVLEKGGSIGFQILEELDLSADVRVTTPNFTILVQEDATQVISSKGFYKRYCWLE